MSNIKETVDFKKNREALQKKYDALYSNKKTKRFLDIDQVKFVFQRANKQIMARGGKGLTLAHVKTVAETLYKRKLIGIDIYSELKNLKNVDDILK